MLLSRPIHVDPIKVATLAVFRSSQPSMELQPGEEEATECFDNIKDDDVPPPAAFNYRKLRKSFKLSPGPMIKVRRQICPSRWGAELPSY